MARSTRRLGQPTNCLLAARSSYSPLPACISHLPPLTTPYYPLPPLTTPYHPLPPSHHPPGCKATECWEEALLRKHTAGGADAEAIGDFMLILCCCHTVIPEEVDGDIQYQAPYYGYTC